MGVGAEVYGNTNKEEQSIALGKYATIFHAVVIAILECEYCT